MKKFCLALAVLALPVVAAPTALAGGVVGARVNPDVSAARKFWTPARINAAKPMDIQRPMRKPGSGGGGTTTTGSAIRWNWTAGPDMSYTNGKVYFADGASYYVCSGTAVSSQYGSVVLTAGHCVNDGGQNRFYSNWFFRPAFNNGFTSYGDWYADHLYTSTDWAVNREFGKDIGAAVISKVGGQSLLQRLGLPGRTTGFVDDSNLNYTTGTNHKIDAYGYPAAGKFNGQSLYHCDSYVSRIDAADPNTLGIPCSMTGGSSGGGWFDTAGNQVSVNSYGYSSLKNVMFGPVFGSAAKSVFLAADTTVPGSTTNTTPPGNTVG